MSERIIKIEPYKTYDDIIRLSGKVILPDGQTEINIPEERNLNLYNYEIENGIGIKPRDYSSLNLKVNLSWRQDSHIGMFDNLVLDTENPAEVLALRMQVQCEKTRWCGEQKKVELGVITKRAVFDFHIPLNEIKDHVKIVAFITRETEAKNIFSEIPTSSLAIVSSCKPLTIQIDEVKDIAGDYLPIGPGNIGDLAFDIQGLDDAFDLPRIFYSEDLKEYLTRDDLLSVNASILTALFYFLDQFLKWLIFICRLDINDKRHKSIVEMFATNCSISKEELTSIIEKEKLCAEQTKAYLELSKKLFKNVQLQYKYKRELRNLFKIDAK